MSVVVCDVLRDARHRDARAARECADWLAFLELENKAPRTLDDYERTVALLLRSFEDVEFSEFTDSHLNRVLTSFPAGSRRTRRAHLSSWFTWGVLTGRLEHNPLDRVPKMQRPGQRVVQTFTDPEIALLTSGVDAALWLILFDTGIRKSEATHLRVEHIVLGFEEPELVVYRGKGSKDRVIPMTRRLTSALASLVTVDGLNPEDHLWYSKPGGGRLVRRDRPIAPSAFHRWYSHTLDQLGIPHRNPHTTRHTFATRCLRAGIPLERVAMLMGHASIRTTADLYAHLDLEDLRQDIRLLEV